MSGLTHPVDKLIARSLSGAMPMFIFILAVLLGMLALNFTAREEEPQIVVPMLDIMVDVPDIAASQVARQVTTPLEKLLAQIPGVEHVYSTTRQGQAAVTLRFHVGENREDAILNTYNKLNANQDQMPSIVKSWQIKPIEVDDVPIMMLGLWSDQPQLYNDYELRRFADEITIQLQKIAQSSEVKVIGGRKRQVQVMLDATAMAARNTTMIDVLNAISVSNQLQQVGSRTAQGQQIIIEAGDVLRHSSELNNLVVNVINGKAVYLKEVATITDGPSEPNSYQWLSYASSHPNSAQYQADYPLVTISIAKQVGSNAVVLTEQVLEQMALLSQEILPKEVHYQVLRDYGATADEKVNNLTSSLAFAVFTVVIFVGVFLGWRPAIVVGLAVPICYGITLFLDMSMGYTINRVTLFALILSLGLLVDDPITGIDNISRFLKRSGDKTNNIVLAMAEIRGALVMSTITIMLAFIPLAYITGMMGPYMAPMAFNVPVSVMVSTAVAFFVTPWLALKLLKPNEALSSDELVENGGWYGRILSPLLANRQRAKYTLWLVLVLFVISAALPIFRTVPLKLLPYDNKNEVQILIDMPEAATLEQTAALSQQIISTLKQLPEVTTFAAYVGEPSAIDFNGMVRRYYQRVAPNLADIRILLLDKTEREHQSHAVVLRMRELLAPLNKNGIRIKVVEVPPGPPVLSTLVAEVSALPFVSDETHQAAAHAVMARLSREAHIVEIDSSLMSPQKLQRFVTNQEKAALSGIANQDIKQTLALASGEAIAGIIHEPSEIEPLDIALKLPYEQRNQLESLLSLQVKGRAGMSQTQQGLGLESAPQPLVALSELGQFSDHMVEQIITRKDLNNVIYVFAELNGRTPAEVISDLSHDLVDSEQEIVRSELTAWQDRHYLNAGADDWWQLPSGTSLSWSGEGEWRITIRVFRDMGIAFAFALAAIFVLLRIQTQSVALSLIIMSAIPLTIIGIMPGFWLMNQFGERLIAGSPEPVLFTATAMIGMIALAGIVVRNSLILVEFITLSRNQGMAIKEALIQAGAVRMRPVLLTAGTTLLGNLIITLDPVFSGLALAIMFGIIASTLFSLFVVPLVYFLVFVEPARELAQSEES
ncbi:efflux RND transporter permease subunit [Pseudoalteromonas tunicata]|uniref:efflux RND transporter permease subunit n=1 Tax=Pseudoalteromonas tunicata TaxID=314281 RepID=UPI00273EF467|nr:efflux RND transporter permease subunit [Pseudoalteromonas tunicata]MDP4984659.1 efflux RND transporter permease subunit [Pseudoalteromonas tunicata]